MIITFNNWAQVLVLSGVAVVAVVAGAPVAIGAPVAGGGAERGEGEGPIPLREVAVVGSRQDVAHMPGSAAFIDGDEIRRNGSADIHAILRAVPGIYTRGEEGYGLFPNISIRGVDIGRSQKLTLMEDGILTAPAPYAAPAAYYAPVVGRMEGLEVLKGSSQIRFGPHTTGGVINYISTRIPRQARRFVRASGGSFDDLRLHAHAGNTHTLGIGDVGWLVEYYTQRNGGFKRIDRTGDFQAIDRTGFALSDYMLKVAWEPNGRRYHRLEAKVGYSDREVFEGYLGLTEQDFRSNPDRRYAASRFDRIPSQQYRTYLRHYWSVTDAIQLTTTLYHNWFHRNWFKLENVNGRNLSQVLADGNGLAVMQGRAAGTFTVRANDRDYRLGGIESVLDWRFGTERLRHDVQAGVRYHEDRVRRFQHDVTYTQNANGTVTSETVGAPGSQDNRREQTDALAVYVQDRISFGRWTVTPGVRYESLDLRQNRPITGGATRKGTLTLLAFGAGATYKPTDEVTWFGGVHRGFSPPDPGARITNGITEERSLGGEIGYRYDDGRIARLEVVGFYTDFDDLLVRNNIGGGGAARTENAGDVVTRGVEVAGTYDLGTRLGWPFRNPWTLAFTFTDARLDGPSSSTDNESIFSGGRDDAKVPYIPSVVFTVGTDLEGERWRVGGKVNFTDRTFTTASNTALQQRLDGTPDARFGQTDRLVTLDLSGEYRIGDASKVFVNLRNVNDDRGVASRHPHGPRPNQPFSAEGGVEWRF